MASGSSLEKLAWLPEGAETLNPKARMAGFQLIHRGKPIFFLPGIPRQMETLLVEQVLPRLATWYQGRQLNSIQQIFKIFGKTESEVNDLVEGRQLCREVEIGYYPVFPDVHLSMTVRGNDKKRTEKLAADTSRTLVEALGSSLYGREHDSLQSVVGGLLRDRGLTLSVAESCSGGLISHLLTTVAGSSSYYLGGVTSYANSMKRTYLGVRQETLDTHGAVSEEVAHAMAQGMREQSLADISLSTTGIAGPDGGSSSKPLGTVFIALATKDEVRVQRFLFSGSRSDIQGITAQTALDIIRRSLLQPSKR